MRKIYMKDVVFEKIDTRRWIAGAVDTNGCSWEICEAETKAECVALARKAVKRFNAEEAQKAQEAETPATETTPATEEAEQTTEEEQTTPATETKYYVIKTTKDGVEYKKYKCIDGWSKNKTECWQFSKQGAENIAKRLNDKYGVYLKIHFNTLEAGQIQTTPAQETSEVLTDIELKLVTSDLINEGWSSEDGEEIKKEFNLTDAQLERVIAQMKAQEEGNAPTYTDADAEQIAASLIDGGWTSEDAEEIQEAYNLTDDQLKAVIEAMTDFENQRKAERINAIVDDLNNLEEELLEVSEEIAEDCEAEGYPSNGSNFELRYEQEKARVNTKIDILLEEAEALGATPKYNYNKGVWEIVKN